LTGTSNSERAQDALARELPERGSPLVYYGSADDVELNADLGERWPVERAVEWYMQQPWIVGVNYFPSYAVNNVDMWQGETFDEGAIRRELGWAADLGLNSVRVMINYVVWADDRDGLLARIDSFLEIAARLGISTVPVLFDDCNFSGFEAKAGPQPEMVPGVFANCWVASLPPGGASRESESWTETGEPYITDIVSAFRQDKRVLLWDLYNEPADNSLPLVAATFRWARACSPTQPLASCQIAERFSDLINLHSYAPLEHEASTTMPDGAVARFPPLLEKIEVCLATRRPVIVTEWMARLLGSRIETHLPFFHDHRIACWSWGLVAGKMQTYLPYPFLTAQPWRPSPAPEVWFHDLLHPDGSPYSELEVDCLRFYTQAMVTTRSPAVARSIATAGSAIFGGETGPALAGRG
jgi:hypothetical protein